MSPESSVTEQQGLDEVDVESTSYTKVMDDDAAASVGCGDDNENYIRSYAREEKKRLISLIKICRVPSLLVHRPMK